MKGRLSSAEGLEGQEIERVEVQYTFTFYITMERISNENNERKKLF